MALPASASAERGAQTFIAASRVPGGTSGTVVAAGPIAGVGHFVLPQGQGPGEFIWDQQGQCALQEEPLFFSAVVKKTGQVTVPNRTAA